MSPIPFAPGEGTSAAYSRKSGIRRIAEQDAAVGVGIRAHAPLALGGELRQLSPEAPVVIEELSGAVAPEPLFQEREVLGMGARIRDGHLVRAERPLDLPPIDDLRPGPPLG